MYFKIDLKIFAIAIMCAFMNKLELYVCIMLFALIHEIGHLLCGLLLGFRPVKFSIMPYGFNVSFKMNYNDYNKKIGKANLITIKRLIVAVAGPATNIIIAISVWLICVCNANQLENQYLMESILYSNILLALFNLLPIYPMDGGRILKEIIHIYYGLRISYDIIQDITWITIAILTATASIMILYFRNIFILVIIFYLWIITIKNIKIISLKQKLLN